VGLERGPLSLVRINEGLFERKSTMLKHLLHSGYHKGLRREAKSRKHMLSLHPSESEPEEEEAFN
jgi:hypothetical protein